ncbi:MAG TPA: GNAT family protein [Candidatus Acidoferrales bacterium]|nr:GNAT family protein [Candidatus Acidoferrales bacterium]
MAETISNEMIVQPVTLSGKYVQLEPMLAAHTAGLTEVGLDEDLWKWIPVPVRTPEEMEAYVEAALADQAKGVSLPFTIVERASGNVIGTTRYANIERVHRRVEIGWTFVGLAWQRTAVNTECKYLLLRHAFETLGCIRVELKTDSLNEKSRKAILRIGAKEEGVFRNHMITASGRIRHSVYFSVTDSEWPAVKRRLEEKLKYSAE